MIYNRKNRKIELSSDGLDNYIEAPDGKYYVVTPFDESGNNPEGGNGLLFGLSSEDSTESLVIKFSKFSVDHPRSSRFFWEIEALELAKSNGCKNVVNIVFYGDRKIGDSTFPYFVMTRCDCTLKQFLQTSEITNSQRFLLCLRILEGIQELHQLELFHRDIKPENILFLGDEPVIADLGLSTHRPRYGELDQLGERIGPCGWFSPEAMNKYWTEKSKGRFEFDCTIDEQSDIFQLGKLFWYIFQGNLPIGVVRKQDFRIGDGELFGILMDMLEHDKARRKNFQDLAWEFDFISRKYGT